MPKDKVFFTIEEIQSGRIEASQVIEPLYDLIELNNLEAYERSMRPFSQPLRLLFAVETYLAEVYNGGHEQFFCGSSGILWRDALKGLAAIGAKEAAAILARAAAKLAHRIADNAGDPCAILDTLNESLLDEDDSAFYAIEIDWNQLEKEYMRNHAADFALKERPPKPDAPIDSAQLLSELQNYFKKCSDYSLYPAYKLRLDRLVNHPLTLELVQFLCDKALSQKHWPELRFAHLRILLLNESSRSFDLKQWYFDAWKRSRRLWLRLFYIRGYAMHATESELEPVMKRFSELLQKNHDYTDYSYILSCGGLPHLVNQYAYPCFARALEIAKAEHEKIDSRLRGMWTLNEQLETVLLIHPTEVQARYKALVAETVNINLQSKNTLERESENICQDVIQLQPGRKYSVIIECKIFRQAFPTVPTLSLPDGTQGYIVLDAARYTGLTNLSDQKSPKLSVRINEKIPAYFIVESASGELHISFQGWVASTDGKGIWQESTAGSLLSMTRKVLNANKVLYGCNAAVEPKQHNCFVFTVEWAEC